MRLDNTQSVEEKMSAGSPADHRKSRWMLPVLILGLLVVAAVALCVGRSLLFDSNLHYRELLAGDQVSLRSGLSLVVPAESTGSLTSWRSLDEDRGNQAELAESGLVRVPGMPGLGSVGLQVFWGTSADALPRRYLFETLELGSEASEAGVEVRWSETSREGHLYNVYIVSRLPGRLPGAIAIEDPGVTDASDAWEVAHDVWQWLSVSGADFPKPVPRK